MRPKKKGEEGEISAWHYFWRRNRSLGGKASGKPIESLADLERILMEKRPGDVVSVTVERTGSDQRTREASFSLALR